MAFGPMLILVDVDAAIARAERRLAGYCSALADRAEDGPSTVRAQYLVQIVEDRLALLRGRRERILDQRSGGRNAL